MIDSTIQAFTLIKEGDTYGGISLLSYEELVSIVFLQWSLPKRKVLPMDIVSALMIMIYFGMIVAFIVSDNNHNKIIPHGTLAGK